jgi:hypothetical protein
MRDVYSSPEANLDWILGHSDSQPGGDFQQPTQSPPRHYTGHPALRPFQRTQIHTPNGGRGRYEVIVPQRPCAPRQNYLDPFTPESDITFPSRTGRDGIALTDVLDGDPDHLIGRDDLMFGNYPGPATSLRLEVNPPPAYLRELLLI